MKLAFRLFSLYRTLHRPATYFLFYAFITLFIYFSEAFPVSSPSLIAANHRIHCLHTMFPQMKYVCDVSSSFNIFHF